MRVVVAIAAMIVAGLSTVPTAAADEPAPMGPPGQTTPTADAPQPEKPADEPQGDPAYGEKPQYETRNFPAPRGKDVVIVSYPDRTKSNITTVAGLAVGGVVLGAVGLYFHLEARSATDDVAAHKFTSEVWTPEKADQFDHARSSWVAAGVLYGLGGGLLLASAVMYIVTEPKAETMVIHPHTSALVAPTRGGAIVGGVWSF